MEDSYAANVKLHDRVPLVTREGTEVQIKEALARKPGATLRVEDIVDDSIVRELEKAASSTRSINDGRAAAERVCRHVRQFLGEIPSIPLLLKGDVFLRGLFPSFSKRG